MKKFKEHLYDYLTYEEEKNLNYYLFYYFIVPLAGAMLIYDLWSRVVGG